MTAFLDSLKYDANGLVAAIVQDVDTGDLLMQGFANRDAICETMQTKLATFWSRSRQERWCKGETSNNYLVVHGVHYDCDRDSLVYLSEPMGPACHTNARTCWFSEAGVDAAASRVVDVGAHDSDAHVPRSTLYALEHTIKQRRAAMAHAAPGEKPSWTARLLADPELLCKKVREEAGELCETLEKDEGRERAASEAADLLYHAMVLLELQGVGMADVMAVLRSRFGVSGIEEKASRSK
ncbi:unnamed protein product [Pedinophyceae sp. YPF-701]|nr:unnamed protein product [Pedinophyceae sp. YPF-701]